MRRIDSERDEGEAYSACGGLRRLAGFATARLHVNHVGLAQRQ